MEALLAEGANVSYCARSVQGTEFVSARGSNPSTATAVGTVVDISSSSAIRAWVEESASKFGRIDTVIANGKGIQSE